MSKEVQAGRVWMLFGARRVGKTSLVETFLGETSERWFRGQGEDRVLAELLGSRALDRYRLAFSNVDGVFVGSASVLASGVGAAGAGLFCARRESPRAGIGQGIADPAGSEAPGSLPLCHRLFLDQVRRRDIPAGRRASNRDDPFRSFHPGGWRSPSLVASEGRMDPAAGTGADCPVAQGLDGGAGDRARNGNVGFGRGRGAETSSLRPSIFSLDFEKLGPLRPFHERDSPPLRTSPTIDPGSFDFPHAKSPVSGHADEWDAR